MKSICKGKRAVPAENIARLADKGKDVSHFFTNGGARGAKKSAT